MRLNLFIIGPSGSGKSTIGKLVAQNYNLAFFSLSELVKAEITAGSGFGEEVKLYISNEKSVPDDLIFDILINKLKTIDNQNFIISGFPKVLNQGRIMDFYLRKLNLPLSLIIYIDKSIEEADPNKKQFEENIAKIKDHFESKKLFFAINGNRPEDIIFKDIVKKINSIK